MQTGVLTLFSFSFSFCTLTTFTHFLEVVFALISCQICANRIITRTFQVGTRSASYPNVGLTTPPSQTALHVKAHNYSIITSG